MVMAKTEPKENERAENKAAPWIKRDKTQRKIIIISFAFLPLLLLFVFTYLPFGEMITYSFYKMRYIGPREFVGWDNYRMLFQRKDIIAALKLCFYYMAGSVIQIALALYLATIFTSKLRGENVFKGLIFFPYLVNGIAIGFIFKFFFTRGFVFDTVLQWCGFQLDNLPYWLRDQRINNWSLVGTSVWRYLGQNMVLFIGAMMSVDTDLLEASQLDGANKWQQFWYIILPSIRTIVTLNIILSITGALSAFEPPYVITNGANGTGTYFVIMDEIAHTQQRLGLASAMAVFLLLIIFIVTIAQRLLFKYVFRNMDVEDQVLSRKEIRKMRRESKALIAELRAAHEREGSERDA